MSLNGFHLLLNSYQFEVDQNEDIDISWALFIAGMHKCKSTHRVILSEKDPEPNWKSTTHEINKKIA